MSLNNLASVNFTAAEITELDTAIASITHVLNGKVINLTPEQRQTYSRINEQNKLFVNKAKLFMEQYPQHLPSFVDKTEFDRDYEARTTIELRLLQLKTLTEQLSDTKILLDHDNYHDSISFYRNIKFLSNENVPGTNTLYDEMNQFFGAPSPGNLPPFPTEPKAE